MGQQVHCGTTGPLDGTTGPLCGTTDPLCGTTGPQCGTGRRRVSGGTAGGVHNGHEQNITLIMIVVILVFMLCNAPARLVQVKIDLLTRKCGDCDALRLTARDRASPLYFQDQQYTHRATFQQNRTVRSCAISVITI